MQCCREDDSREVHVYMYREYAREGGSGRGAKREIEKRGVGRRDLLWSRVLLLKDLIPIKSCMTRKW